MMELWRWLWSGTAGEGDAPLPDGRPRAADEAGPEQLLPPAQEASLADSAEGPGHEDKLSVCNKLCYAIGGAPYQAASSAIAFFLQIYLLDVAQITPFHASLVLFFGKACGALADPVAGFLISKSKQTKIGRLMPWLLGCTPFTVLSYFFLWYLPPFKTGRVMWYSAFYCLFQVLSILYLVPYCALTMFLSTDQKDRDSATAYRIMVEVLGTLVGAAVHGQIVASAHTFDHCSQNATEDFLESSDPHQDHSDHLDVDHGRNVYMIAAMVIGGTYLVCTTVLFFGVKEKDDPYALSSDKKVPFFKGLILTMKYGPYMKFTASFLLISTAVQLEQSNFVLFCIQTASLQSHFQNLVLTILVSAVLSVPFWQWFLLHFGKKEAACGISWMIPLVLMLVTIPSLTVAYMAASASGLSIAASLLLPWSMLPDVVDRYRLQNPRSTGHETIFYSSYIFFTKISAGIGLGISASSLELVGYKSGACRQPDNVVTMLKILLGGVPSGLIALGLFILLFYPIDKKSQKETTYALEMLRQSNSNMQKLNKTEGNTLV
ncbi:sphingosine-1-phosphate transporter MFSD2B [Paroedura picta]|uniref:sphingosine-1-phosphate transporter MFSD2B n=1 Tax=Paroedura picta TaxID=143630 RepID=UPI004056FB2F